MSDHWITVIPRDPSCAPAQAGIVEALAFLEEIAPGSDEVTYSVDDRVLFRDCGQNLESILCPNCGAALDQDWWLERMEEQGDEGGFELSAVELPCCGGTAMLNELKYFFDQGFSRFVLEAMNPNIGELTREQIQRLGELLGTELRVIYQNI